MPCCAEAAFVISRHALIASLPAVMQRIQDTHPGGVLRLRSIDAAELSIIQHDVASGAQPATVWNHEDIQQRLRTSPHEKQELLVHYGRYQSVLGVWYDLRAWVNELFPGQNDVVISLEDSDPHFVHRLFTKYFARDTVYRRNQSPQDIAWLGKLALLHLGDVWWEQPDGLHFFSQMVEEHHQLFSFY